MASPDETLLTPPPATGSGSTARRAFSVLCAIYLLLGLAHTGHFLFSGLADLREAAIHAQAQATTLEQSAQRDGLRERIQQHQDRLVEIRDTLEEIPEDLREIDGDIQRARNQLQPIDEKLQPLEAELTQLVQQSADHPDRVDLEERAAPLREQAAPVRARIDSLEDQETRLQTQRENLRAEREEVRALLDAAEAEQNRLLAARAAADDAREAARRGWVRLGGLALAVGTVAWFLAFYRRRLQTRQEAVAATAIMIIVVGTLLLASRLVLQRAVPNITAWGLLDLAILHVVACAVMPWTAREAIIPFAPLLFIWALTFLVPGGSDLEIFDRLVGVIVSPAALAPGVLMAGWGARRRDELAERQFLGQQVRSMGGELSRARIVHDAMFPDPTDTGHVTFEYEYLPIAEIGGDYVHLHVCPDSECVYLTLLDVAGHGLAAALTVNRLFGELERIRAEDPDATPGDVIALLNRYISLTMARHDLYATGTCLMLDPNGGDLTWANAGHPPAMLRRTGGDVAELPCTTVLLGALEPDEFRPNQQQTRLLPGDVVIAYTDGTFEARDKAGRCFGLESLRQTARFSPPPRSWPKFIAHAVTSHHDGCADDDILIASLTLRSLRITGKAPAREAVAAAT